MTTLLFLNRWSQAACRCRSQGGIRLAGIRELIQDQDHRLITDQLSSRLEGILPGVEAGHGLAFGVRPAPYGAGESHAHLGGSIPVGHPVNERSTGLLGPIEQQGGLADPPAAVDEDELRTALR